MAKQNNAPKETKKAGGLLKGRWVIWSLALLFSILAAFGVLLIVGKAADRVQYYVAAQDLPARSPITQSNTVAVDVNADAVPATALTLAEINSGDAYAKIALPKGEPITASVAGPLDKLNYNLPPNYVATSLQVAPERAVGGKIKTGDYIDIAAVNGETSKVVMQHVLVLDVTVNPSSIAEAANDSSAVGTNNQTAQAGPDSQAVRTGIPQVYTFAVSPENFAKMALLNGNQVLLALSQNSTASPSPIDAQASKSEMFSNTPVTDAGEGLENVFPNANPSPSASPAPTPSTR